MYQSYKNQSENPGYSAGHCQQMGIHHITNVDQETCQQPNDCGDEDKEDKIEELEEGLISPVGHTHAHGHGHGHLHNGVAMVGWMIILGDGLHNFADGLGENLFEKHFFCNNFQNIENFDKIYRDEN